MSSTVVFDVAAIRKRFSALDRDLAFFDGPGGTQVPDEVIDAISRLPPRVERQRQWALRDEQAYGGTRQPGPCDRGALPRLLDGGDRVRREHDDAEFRALAHAGPDLEAGRRDPRHAPRPRRERLALARAGSRPRARGPLRRHPARTRASTSRISRHLGERTKVVAFPLASNAVGTLPDVRAIATSPTRRVRSPGPTRCTTGRTRPIDVGALGVDVLVCSPYKFFGPHLGLAFGRRELLEPWRPYKVGRPRTSRSAAASRPARSRTSSSPASSPPWTTSTRSAGRASSPGRKIWASASSRACRRAAD